MEKHDENQKRALDETSRKKSTCPLSTSAYAETPQTRYFGTYPGDMEEFVTNFIDRKMKYYQR